MGVVVYHKTVEFIKIGLDVVSNSDLYDAGVGK